MKAWKPLWRWIAASTVFAALVAVGVVVFGRDGGDGVAGAPQVTEKVPSATEGGQGAAQPPVDDDEALVNRMLDQIREGKPVEPQFATGDNPAAGAPIQAIKAKPGEQLRLGQLSIPKLGVKQQLNNGVDEAALVKGVGHWPGTPLPGSAGNSVISGHRVTNGQPFRYLDKLRPGDPIVVTVGNTTTTYKVRKTTIVPQSEYVKFVLQQPKSPGDKLITLFACNPITAHYQRIVVEASAG